MHLESGSHLLAACIKDKEEGCLFSLPACSHSLCEVIPSLALEPTLLDFWLILKTSGDTQLCRLNNNWILRPYMGRQLF